MPYRTLVRSQRTPVLDLSDEVRNDGEQGLLGLAFSSDGGRLYVDFTAATDGRTVVLEYELDTRGDVDEDTRRQLPEVAQPYPNHNGSQLATGRDGDLYIGLGDGGKIGRANDGSPITKSHHVCP